MIILCVIIELIRFECIFVKHPFIVTFLWLEGILQVSHSVFLSSSVGIPLCYLVPFFEHFWEVHHFSKQLVPFINNFWLLILYIELKPVSFNFSYSSAFRSRLNTINSFQLAACPLDWSYHNLLPLKLVIPFWKHVSRTFDNLGHSRTL